MEEAPYNNQYPQQFSEEESNFDIKEWIGLILRYWYLFVIFITLALGYAYLKNRSWIASYRSLGTLMIASNTNTAYGSQALMQGFGVQSGYNNYDNQKYILTSYDFISRVVDSLPQLNIDYITKGRFRIRNIYDQSPIEILADYVSPDVYDVLFRIDIRKNGSYSITNEENSSFKVSGQLNVPVQTNYFFITVQSRSQSNASSLFFRFNSRAALINDFQSRLQADYVSDGSSVIALSLVSPTPQRDIDFINKLSSTYLSDNLEQKNDAANKTIKFIDEQLGDVKKSLETSEDAMTKYRQSNKILDITNLSTEATGNSSAFKQQQNDLRLKETYFNYLTNYLKTNLESGSVVAPASLGINDPMLITLIQNFNDALLLRNETTKKNPMYPKYNKDVETLKNTINEVLKNMKASMLIEQNNLNKNIATVNQQLLTIPQKEMEMSSLERKYRIDDNYYTFFLQKKAEAQIQKASNSPDNSILDKARQVGGVTNSDVKSKNYITYGAIGLVIPLFIIILTELLNTSIRNVKDVEKNSTFPLIGNIRHTENNNPVLASKYPRSSFAEMFRVIRTRIEFIVQRKTKISILVTSAESGDGKTYFCTNLAAVYAMTGKKTLLIDMDIRKPSITERFSLKENYGVTNYLIGEKTLDEIILKKEEYDFDILLTGVVPPNPGELIRSEKLKEMLNILQERYDYLIIDTSPIGLVADAYSLALLTDVNLFVIRSEKTNKAFFKKLNTQLKADKVHNLYLVLNDVNVEKTNYMNKYSYGYGGGYGSYGGYGTYGTSILKRKKKSGSTSHYYNDDEKI